MCSQGALADADVSAPDVVDAVVGATVDVEADAGDAMVLFMQLLSQAVGICRLYVRATPKT